MASLDRDFFVASFRRMAVAAEVNRDEWTRLDGQIGDGDHGINMSKGFLRAGDLLASMESDLSASLNTLGNVLLTEIGGAMGPLYGTFFLEMGIGHHGEPGVAVTELKPAKAIAKDMLDLLLPDLPFGAGDELVVLVSGLGATPIMELYIFYGAVADMLAEQGMQVHRSYVGNYFTSLEMMGVTLTIMKVDEELKELIDLEADSVGFRQF